MIVLLTKKKIERTINSIVFLFEVLLSWVLLQEDQE